jgi:SsrA-binding protein
MEKQSKSPTIVNRKAWHEYTIEDEFEAGIELVGTEVKSIRDGKVNMQDAYCRVENGEVWLYQMNITPYEFANRWGVDPRRKRKLLLHRNEIDQLRVKAEQKGLTIVPLRIFFQRGFAKMVVGIGRGKKLYDKRQAIADRDVERERRRAEAARE